MVLLRLIVLHGLTNNVNIKAKHIPGKQNLFSDFLSRMKYRQFWQLARKEGRKFNNSPTPIPSDLQMSELWIN